MYDYLLASSFGSSDGDPLQKAREIEGVLSSGITEVCINGSNEIQYFIRMFGYNGPQLKCFCMACGNEHKEPVLNVVQR